MSEQDLVFFGTLPESTEAPQALRPAEQALLAAIDRRLVARESTEALLDYLFEAMHPVSPCDRISIAFAVDQGRRLESHYTRANYEPLVLGRGYRADLAGSSLETVIEKRQLRVIRDLERYLENHPDSASTKLLLREGVRSSLTCPLLVEGRVVGVLFRSARSRDAYDREQVPLHAALAERIAAAVEKTYRLEQLSEANRAYDEMLGLVSHELKSPIASIMSSMDLILQGYLGPVTDEQREAFQRIMIRGRYLLDLVRDYLELSRVESPTFALSLGRDVDFMTDVLAVALDLVEPQRTARRQTLLLDVPEHAPGLVLDVSMLRMVMVNLLTNAVKYGRDEGEIVIAVRPSPKLLQVSVRNQGQGFSPGQRSRLFRKFSRLEGKDNGHARGSGVGLYTVWRIVDLHGGRVTADSQPGAWAEFGFSIPQPG